MDRILLLSCNLLSCFIIISILFQFMNDKYIKNYKNTCIYVTVKGVAIAVFTIANMQNKSLLNLFVWILIVGICVNFLYYEEDNKAGRRLIECETLALCMVVCESVGVLLLQWILQLLDVQIKDKVIFHCLEVTFSKVILIFLYYLTINRLIRKKNYPASKTQYSVYVIMLIYSLVNMLLIAAEFVQKQTNYLWVANMGCIVLADLYLLYFIKMSNDKGYYEKLAETLEQQAKMQYEYYLSQSEKYNSTLQVLHDVNKHIKAVGELYTTDHGELATEYTKQITNMLKPLIPIKYTGNPILDILLSDKALEMKEKGIDFQVDIDNVDLKGIEPIDVTTIFGNLLDNAIEAAEKLEGYKYVYIKIGAYHQMISVKVENSSKYVKWKNGLPISEKGKDRGIGILNVKRSVSKYDGDINFIWKDNKFIVEMYLNT